MQGGLRGASPPGTNGDTSQNTVGLSPVPFLQTPFLSPPDHCSHTGPGGRRPLRWPTSWTTMGTATSYCILLQQACRDGTLPRTISHGSDRMARRIAPPKLDALGAKTRLAVQGLRGTDQWQHDGLPPFWHVSRALSDPTECPSALWWRCLRPLDGRASPGEGPGPGRPARASLPATLGCV